MHCEAVRLRFFKHVSVKILDGDKIQNQQTSALTAADVLSLTVNTAVYRELNGQLLINM